MLRPDGVYLLNVIDYGELALRAGRGRDAAATRSPTSRSSPCRDAPGGPPGGGNLVLIASERPLPAAVALDRRAARARTAAPRSSGSSAGADPLTDDDAPADQLLSAGT